MSTEYVRVNDNALNSEELQQLQQFFEANVSWRFGSQSDRSVNQFGHWNFDFLDALPDNQLSMEEYLACKPEFRLLSLLWDKLKKTQLQGHQLVRMYANAHTYGVEGYPHIDTIKKGNYATVIYLNPYWEMAWAGETVLFNELQDSIAAILPRPGRAVTFNATTTHTSRSPSRRCPALRVCIVIKTRVPQPSSAIDENYLDFLRALGADKQYHSNRASLLDHLIGTYDLLTANGCNEDLCLAGLFHSIYGTTKFDIVSLSSEKRAELKQLIGNRAEEIVHRFSTLNRPEVLESSLQSSGQLLEHVHESLQNISTQEIEEILTLECANLIDQKAIYQYPNIAQYAQRIGMLDSNGLTKFSSIH